MERISFVRGTLAQLDRSSSERSEACDHVLMIDWVQDGEIALLMYMSLWPETNIISWSSFWGQGRSWGFPH
jgi:hypothetical protein